MASLPRLSSLEGFLGRQSARPHTHRRVDTTARAHPAHDASRPTSTSLNPKEPHLQRLNNLHYHMPIDGHVASTGLHRPPWHPLPHAGGGASKMLMHTPASSTHSATHTALFALHVSTASLPPILDACTIPLMNPTSRLHLVLELLATQELVQVGRRRENNL